MMFLPFYKKLVFISIFSINIFFPIIIFADDYFTLFEEDFAVSLFVKYNMGVFNNFNHPEHRTDKPFDVGLGIRYKTISARLSVPIIFNELFNDWAFDFEMDSYFDNVFYEAYFKNYPNFYIGDTDIQSGLSIHSSGVMATFIHNQERHSLNSVITLDRKQNISSGSLLYGFGVFHTSLYSADKNIEKLSDRQHLLYFGPSIGYSYIWAFSNNIFINTSLSIFTSPGINISTGNWLFIPQLEPKIAVGHHNNTWSINLIMKNNAKFIIWDTDAIDILTLVSVNLIFSKRF